ncbi:MAG: type IX secretion system membrane protein PorP/SprF [Bacteroidales bacterium]|nr:type IX secretion system membrane protein PorP/SprF [Bacteroidales bacterium]
MKKVTLLLFVFLLLRISAFSQVQLTQYMMDGSVYNPAFVGSEKAIMANMFGRKQWMGFEDASGNKVSPRTFVFNLQSPVYSFSSGIGLNVVSDRLGFEQNFGVKINYAYRFTLGDNHRLGAGLALSFLNKTIDFGELVVEDPGDPLLKFDNKQSATFFDLDLGVHYRFSDKAYAGLSVTNLLQSSRGIGNVRYHQKTNIYFTGGYYYPLTGLNFKTLYIIPSFLLKTNFASTQIDLNVVANYNHQYWAGISYRYQDAVAVLAGIRLYGFDIGLSYDITTSKLSTASSGSVEVFVGYRYPIKPKIKPKSLYNTRYL